MSEIDLHIHTNASDGRFSPAEIVQQASNNGLTVIAICDHDTINGIAPALEAAEAYPGLRVIPGVEISTDVASGEVHILGYFIDYTDHELGTALERLRHSRINRAQGMLVKLKHLGINIEWQRVQEIAGNSTIGRPHIAQAMLEKGYISILRDAFTRFISRDGPAYVEREKMTPAESVQLIVRSKGLPVLAHPFTFDNPEELVMELKLSGLIGIEAYYNGFTYEETNRIIKLADKYNIIATGGSDYHGLDMSNETMMGAVEVPVKSAEQLIFLAEQKGLI
ncbi:PHP domain-containing protein [Chloroflexota bacterium]